MKSNIFYITKKLCSCIKLFCFFVIALVLMMMLTSPNHNAHAQLLCPPSGLIQITDFQSGDSSRPSIDGDGRLIAFTSNADIDGGNGDGNNEIYLYSLRTRKYTQITSTTSGDSLEPDIDLNGQRIYFQSTSNIGGGNPDGNNEIYLYDLTTGMTTQITSTTSGQNNTPSTNGNGTLVVFESSANITGQNPDGMPEVVLYNTTTGVFTQITISANSSLDPDIDANGTRIGFHSHGDFTGQNPENNREMFIYDLQDAMFIQVTFTGGGDDSFQASLNADGNRMGFHSSGNITGQNPDGNIEVFLYDDSEGETFQITQETSGLSANPTIDTDTGTRIAFQSNSNIDENNPESNFEVYIYEMTTETFIQLTFEPSGNSALPVINSDGTRTTFESNANINDRNQEGNTEVYLQICADPTVPIPTLNEWGMIAMVAILGIAGFIVLRRHRIRIAQ